MAEPKSLLLFLIIAALFLISVQANAGTIIVNSLGDANSRDALITLREAIMLSESSLLYATLDAVEQAQVTPPVGNGTPDTIDFSISGTISPTSALPPINDNGTVIDASSRWSGVWPAGQPGIVLDGIASGATSGLIIPFASNCRISGLFIRNFPGSGIFLAASGQFNTIGGTAAGYRNVISSNGSSGIFIDNFSNNNTVSGNYIGTDVAGTADLGNGANGIIITGGAYFNTVGGSIATGEGNVISGNDLHGVAITGSASADNTVSGNYIGTDVNGTADLGNSGHGVYIYGRAVRNIIGGTTIDKRNIISGNDDWGIQIEGISPDNVSDTEVLGNYIGIDVTGIIALGNTNGGVIVVTSESNTIGGTTPGERNIISGNGDDGVRISGPDTSGNLVSGNYIGTNANGDAALGNVWDGVVIDSGAQSNIIGGTTAGERNIISGNHDGVHISGAGTNNNTVSGNYIGTNANGDAALGNAQGGVYLNLGAQFNTVGGTTAGERNIISGNGGQGVVFHDSGTDNNTVSGNYIGTNANGDTALGNNGLAGVFLDSGTQSNTIGGTTAGERNIISGNSNWGIAIHDSGTNNNTVSGNYIGANANGTADLGNGSSGVILYGGAQSNTIGGTTAGERNIISGNGQDGITIGIIFDSGTNNNTVSGNYIGTNTDGDAALGNGGSGVYIWSGAQSNTIGGITENHGNIVAFNAGDGIRLWNAGTDYNRISHNSIHDNSGLGIDLVGGANDEISAPVIGGSLSGNVLTVSGYSAGANATVEVFRADSAASGEGEVYLGSVIADGSGNFSGTIDVTGEDILIDTPLAATTTHTNENTSEFGLFLPLTVTLTSTYDEWESGVLTIEAETRDPDGLIVSVLFQYSRNNSTWNDIATDFSSPYSVNWDTTSAIPTADNSVWLRVIATDVGSSTIQDVIDASFGVDNEPPETTDDYDGEWHNADFVINLTGDDEDSGIESIIYILNDGEEMYAPWDGQPNITTEGSTNELEYWGVDNAGNEEEHHIISDIKLDKTPPETTDDYDGEWRNADFFITLTSDDASGSDIVDIYYKLNDSEEKTVSLDGQPMINIEGNSNQLEYWSIDNAGNSEEHHILSDIKLDKTEPIFSGWQYEPTELTQLSQGAFHVKVEASDSGGSGISGDPVFDYHIGDGTDYDGYEAMTNEGEGVWSFDIIADWSDHPGETIYYKAQLSDVAGNVVIGPEFTMLIEIKLPPLVEITSRYSRWERGTLAVEAESSDPDGTVMEVLFQYSLNDSTWHDIGVDRTAPYSVNWDTISVIPEADDSVWVRAIATDNDDLTGQDIRDFGVDNELPETRDNYDGEWHNADFSIKLTGDDGDGSGVEDIYYRINDGVERIVASDGQPVIDTEGSNNKLEYWAVDEAGNEEEHNILEDIKLDKTLPVTTDDYDGEWHNEDFVIVLSGHDEISGIESINYRINNGILSSVARDGDPLMDKNGGNNRLEYWAVDFAGNIEIHHILDNIKLDKIKPSIFRWQRPTELTQGHQGAFHVQLEASDSGGSGISDDSVFDYHIGDDTDYDGYEAMTNEGDGFWSFDIIADWHAHPGEILYYKAQVSDIAGNVTTSSEFAMLIEELPAPLVEITSTYEQWESGTLAIEAEASDPDGVVVEVLFQYSLDDSTWNDIGIANAEPYLVDWNTISVIPGIADSVWVRARATDNDGLTGQGAIDTSFGVDNEPPETSNDYDGEWHGADFPINLIGGDGSGSGLADIHYRINDGEENAVSIDGQPIIDAEGNDNQLEYWGIDNVGNVEEPHTLSDIKLDRTPPVTIDDYDGEWHNADFFIALASDDGSGSGLADIYYRINGGEEKAVSLDGQPMINTEGNDSQLEYWGMDSVGNEEEHHILGSIKLDRTGPVFSGWQQPGKLTRLSQGAFHVTVEATDQALVESLSIGKSGISGNPVFDYHIGDDTDYDGYEAMTNEGDGFWSFDIIADWLAHPGEILHYKAQVSDIAGNITTSSEFTVLIEELPPPLVEVTSTYGRWERGTLKIEAEASDPDGNIVKVLFQYSLDGNTWLDIGIANAEPYSVDWDTASAIPAVDDSVWLLAMATDNDGLTGQDVIDISFGVDNEPPETSNDYDGEWHNADFPINLIGDDGSGIGVADVHYKINGGEEKTVLLDGQPLIDVERNDNQLEYWAVDNAGNVESSQTLSNIRLDRTPPVSADDYDGQWRNADFSINLTADDVDGSGVAEIHYRINNGEEKTLSLDGQPAIDTEGGSNQLEYWAVDTTGNVEGYQILSNIRLDKTPPVSVDGYDGGWHNADFSINLTGDDGSGSGLADIHYRINSGEGKTVSLDGQPLINAEGNDNQLEYWAIDNAGNSEEIHTLIDIGLDKSPPSGSITIDNGAEYTNTRMVILTLSASDDGIGVDETTQMRFSNDNVTYTEPEPYTFTKEWLLLEGDGETTVYVQYGDALENWIPLAESDSIILDTTLPDGTVVINSGDDYCRDNNVLLTISAIDSISGVAEMMFSEDNSTFSLPESYSSSKTWELSSGEGVKTVYVKLKDASGNWSTNIITDTIELYKPSLSIDTADKTASEDNPTISFSASFNDPLYKHTATIDWGDGTKTDRESVVSPFTETHTYTGDNGSYTVEVSVIDDSGDSMSASFMVDIANVLPVVNAGEDQTADEDEEISINATFTDGGLADTHMAEIDWGDGTVEPGRLTESEGSGTIAGSHTYSGDGVYTIAITVKDDDDDSGTDGLTVSIIPCPNIASISPSSCTAIGGISLTIIGEDFQVGASVAIGGKSATDVAFVSSTQITATVPDGLPGPADVMVTNPDGQTAEMTGIFTYIEPDTEPPEIVNKQLFPEFRDQNVPVTSAIQIEFSEPINVTELQQIKTMVTGNNNRTIAGKLEFDDDQQILTFVPAEPFGDEENVTVIIPEVEDLAGNRLEADFQKTFSTGLGIWPGDTNNDGKVDVRDIVPIGRHWGSEGEKRPDMPSEWQICPVVPWSDKPATYADANGDGTVNEQDILSIVSFWKQSRQQNQSAAPRFVATGHFALEREMLNAYQAMYDILESLPPKTEGVRVLKFALEEIMADIRQSMKPGKSRLLQNYPNPCNPETWIPYQLAEPASISINIYDINGRLVRALEVGQKAAGYYLSKQESAYWNGRNQDGERVCSGIYIYHIRAGEFEGVGKLIIAR
ncbi:PKD domain-containing protein [Candidatus Poribacteria bacterium]